MVIIPITTNIHDKKDDGYHFKYNRMVT